MNLFAGTFIDNPVCKQFNVMFMASGGVPTSVCHVLRVRVGVSRYSMDYSLAL